MNETFAAELTGPGRAAVATVVVKGPQAIASVMSRFTPARKSVNTLKQDKIYFGTWSWRSYEEELVVCRVAADQVEVHCHGGQLAARTILASLAHAHATVVPTNEWLNHLYQDRFVREALALLPQVRTSKAAAIVLDQSRHAMRQMLTDVQDNLAREHFVAAVDQLTQTISYAALGTRLADPFRVVLLGEPNSGKSSLVNAMVGFDRTIVYDQPGTTRDVVSVETALDGWPITLSDTAGIRETTDLVERAGIELAKQRLLNADLILLIQDLTNPASTIFEPSLNLQHAGKKSILVGTKCDLSHATHSAVTIKTSATQGIGIEALCSSVVSELVPELPQAGSAVTLTHWQLQLLESLLSLIQQRQLEKAQHMIMASLGMSGDEVDR